VLEAGAKALADLLTELSAPRGTSASRTSRSGSRYARDIGLTEVPTHKEEGLAGKRRHGVGQAVSEIERCEVPALSEAQPSSTAAA